MSDNNNGNNGNNNGNGNNNVNSNSATQNSPTIAPSSQNSQGSASGSVTGSVNGGNGTISATAGGNATASATNTSTISIPATAAAGGVQMLQPVSTVTTFYKFGASEYITFKWNLTSLYVHPTSLTVRAYCADLNVEYPVGPTPTGSNANYSAAGILPGNATQVVWNPYQWKDLPGIPQFAQATYTLRMYDERGPSAPANKGGYLSPYMDKTKFAIYMPRDYVDFSAWTCPTCGASLDSPATLPILMSLFIMIISAWGLLRR